MLRFNFNKIIFITALTLIFLTFFASKAQANTDLHGWAWSSTIGWISFNFSSSAASGGTWSPGVSMDSGGNLSGYAWSPNIGWIKFGRLSGFPTYSGSNNAVNASIDTSTGIVSGWARACAGTVKLGDSVTSPKLTGDCSSMTSRPDGWDGWIELSGKNHVSGRNKDGVTYDPKTGAITGYAWGSDVVGWISFDLTSTPAGVLSCSANPSSMTLPPGGPIIWSVNIPAGDHYTYEWSGDDGLSATSASVTKTYTTSGIKTASVSLTPQQQSSGSSNPSPKPPIKLTCESANITIAPPGGGPTVSINPASTNVSTASSPCVDANHLSDTSTFTVSVSGATPASYGYRVNVGQDQTINSSGSSITKEITWSTSGSQTVYFWYMANGVKSSETSTTVDVKSSCSPTTPLTGITLHVIGSLNDDGKISNSSVTPPSTPLVRVKKGKEFKLVGNKGGYSSCTVGTTDSSTVDGAIVVGGGAPVVQNTPLVTYKLTCNTTDSEAKTSIKVQAVDPRIQEK